MTVARFPSLAHWGAFTALVENGRLVGCEPFARDPAPSSMLDAMPEMVHSPLRIARPAIREGWREGKPRTGADSYREVSWDEALDTVAGEVKRVREAVRPHLDPRRLLRLVVGRARASRAQPGAAVPVPRRRLRRPGRQLQLRRRLFPAAARDRHLRSRWSGEVTDWSSVVKHTRLIIAFGGLATKNGQVTSGGAGAHTMEMWLRRAKDGRHRVRLGAARSSPTRPISSARNGFRSGPNTDTAMMLAMAHTLLVRGALRRATSSRAIAQGFEAFRRYLLGLDDGIAKDADWAAAITGVAADTIRDLARRAAATRSMITCAWSLQRAHHGEQPYWAAITLAAMLGGIGLPGGGFAFGHGSTNGIGAPRVRHRRRPRCRCRSIPRAP